MPVSLWVNTQRSGNLHVCLTSVFPVSITLQHWFMGWEPGSAFKLDTVPSSFSPSFLHIQNIFYYSKHSWFKYVYLEMALHRTLVCI